MKLSKLDWRLFSKSLKRLEKKILNKQLLLSRVSLLSLSLLKNPLSNKRKNKAGRADKIEKKNELSSRVLTKKRRNNISTRRREAVARKKGESILRKDLVGIKSVTTSTSAVVVRISIVSRRSRRIKRKNRRKDLDLMKESIANIMIDLYVPSIKMIFSQ